MKCCFSSFILTDDPELVIHSSSPSYNALLGIKNILTNECDSKDAITGMYNYYLTPNGVADGYVTLDLGCSTCIASISLKNSKGLAK